LKKSVLFILMIVILIFSFYFKDKKENKGLEKRFGKILFQKSSDYGVVTVGEKLNFKALFINHRKMCEQHTQLAAQDLSRVSNFMGKAIGDNSPTKSKVLNIGLGCGLTAANLYEHQNISDLDIVE